MQLTTAIIPARRTTTRPPLARQVVTALLIGALAVLTTAAYAQRASSREYAIKAAFIYNFAKFVDWPAQALPESKRSIVIGVLGANPFGSSLASINGKTVKGRTLVVKRVGSLQEARTCQILFISSSEQGRLQAVLKDLGNSSILTIGEMKGFARSGGIINFTKAGSRIRFEINTSAAERARLTISSQLLKLAKVVRT